MESRRMEHDSMGSMEIPGDAYYGAQTARAVENFPISSLRFPREFIRALGIIKRAAAVVNRDLGLFGPDEDQIPPAIVEAADRVIRGELDDQFVVDLFQTG